MTIAIAFLGPLVGSLARPFGGLLADKIGGAIVTFWNFIAMGAATIGVLYFVGIKDFTGFLNPDSLHTLTRCVVERALAAARPGEAFQFEREGYFCLDPAHVSGNQPVFNRTVTLRDTWAKIAGQAD